MTTITVTHEGKRIAHVYVDALEHLAALVFSDDAYTAPQLRAIAAALTEAAGEWVGQCV